MAPSWMLGPALAWALLSESPAPCVLFEAVRDTKGLLVDFQWLDFNRAAEALVRELGVGRKVSLWVEAMQGLPEVAVLGQVVETGQPHTCEVRCRPGGREQWYKATAVKHGDCVVLWLFDVTAELQARQAVREELEQARAARQRAEEALAVAARIDQETPLGYGLFDLELRHQHLSPVLARLEGLEPKQALGQPLSPTVAPVLRPLCRRALERDGPVVLELSPETWPGQTVPGDWQVVAFPVHREGRPVGIAMVVTDISELKRSTRLLQAREQHLRLALETARMVAWEWKHALRTVTWSPNAAAFFGLPPNRLGNTLEGFLACIHPEDRARVLKALQRLLRAAGPYSFQFRGLWPDGTVRCYEAVGQALREDTHLIRMLGVIMDCTEREEAQASLREAEERYRLAAWATNDVLWDWDLSSDQIHWGEATTTVFGYRPKEMGDIHWWREHLHPQEREQVVKGLEQVVGGVGESWSSEYRFRHKDGTYVYVLDRGRVSRDAQGRAIRMIGSMMDITERKRAMERMRQEAEFRERFIGILGHDLRLPLNAISLSARTLRKRSDSLAPSVRQIAERIGTSAERMGDMISDILDLTRARLAGGIPLRLEPMNLCAVCRQVVEELSVAYPERCIVFELEGEGEAVLDRARMEQVVSNLVGNALEHGSPEGTVLVRCVGREEQRLLEVSNPGAPIPEHELATLFDPFRQVDKEPGKRRGEGLGLGLFIVHEIVLAHGGTVQVRSTEQEGTTFTVTLPRHARPPGGPLGG